MAFFIVSMSHPNEEIWKEHIDAHMAHLHALLREGTLRASGKVVDASVKTGLLLLVARDRPAVEGIIASDPFARAGAIGELKITEWDPFLGLFAAESSGQAPVSAGSGPQAT